MLLGNKRGGGKVGAAIACAFACEGGKVFLTGRTLERLEEAADL